MRLLTCSLLIVLLGVLKVSAPHPALHARTVKTLAASGTGPTGIIYGPFDFEEAGAPDASWTASNATFDDAVNPLRLTESLRCNPISGFAQSTNLAQGHIYGHVRFRSTDVSPSGVEYFVLLRDAAGAEIATIQPRTDGNVRVTQGAISATTSSAPMIDAGYYHFWFEFQKAVAVDGIMRLWISTNTVTTRPGSVTIETTVGTSTADQAQIRWLGGGVALVTNWFDQVVLTTNSFTTIDP